MRSFSCLSQTTSKGYKGILTKGYGTPVVDAICEILHAPKRFFIGDVSYAVSIGPNLVKGIIIIVPHTFSIFTAVERIPRDKQGGVVWGAVCAKTIKRTTFINVGRHLNKCEATFINVERHL